MFNDNAVLGEARKMMNPASGVHPFGARFLEEMPSVVGGLMHPGGGQYYDICTGPNGQWQPDETYHCGPSEACDSNRCDDIALDGPYL